jgi:hypothetical protein
MEINGNTYVADDLELRGVGSKVTLKGNYYGYNFQKNYGTSDTVSSDADFSSAMMVNGRTCNLNLKDLNYLMLAGRTFISRKTDAAKNQDVLMGESISARTNQLAYYVPAEYVKNGTFDRSGYAAHIGISDDTLQGYLNSSQPLVAYYFPEGMYYYLNFKTEQDANDFFAR